MPLPRLGVDLAMFGNCIINIWKSKESQESPNIVISMDSWDKDSAVAPWRFVVSYLPIERLNRISSLKKTVFAKDALSGT